VKGGYHGPTDVTPAQPARQPSDRPFYPQYMQSVQGGQAPQNPYVTAATPIILGGHSDMDHDHDGLPRKKKHRRRNVLLAIGGTLLVAAAIGGYAYGFRLPNRPVENIIEEFFGAVPAETPAAEDSEASAEAA
jgi:hypothetical protein